MTKTPRYKTGDIVRVREPGGVTTAILLSGASRARGGVEALWFPDGDYGHAYVGDIQEVVPRPEVSKALVKNLVRMIVPYDLYGVIKTRLEDTELPEALYWARAHLQARLGLLDMRRFAHKVDAGPAKKVLRGMIRDTEKILEILTRKRR